MKIEEAKEKIEEHSWFSQDPNNNEIDIRTVFNIIDQIQLNQPKPVVPQFVADWYEEHKDKLEEELCYQIWLIRESGAETDFEYWLTETENPIQILINMHQFGYKEKLYTVEIPNPNTIAVTILVKSNNGKIVMCNECDINWKCNNRYQLTEQEIRKDFDWAFRWAKEVE